VWMLLRGAVRRIDDRPFAAGITAPNFRRVSTFDASVSIWILLWIIGSMADGIAGRNWRELIRGMLMAEWAVLDRPYRRGIATRCL